MHEIFRTDTADYADILLPATTQLEQTDVHSSYGHLYALANNPAIAPLGEAKPNTEVFRLLAARMGFAEPCFRDSDDDLARQAFRPDHPRAAGIAWDKLKAKGFQRLAVPAAYAPFAEGGFPTPSGKCEFHSATLAREGHDPLPTFVPPRESVGEQSGARQALSAGVPVAAGAQLPQLVVREPAGVRRRGKDAAARPPSGRCARPARSRPAIACASSTTAEASPQRRA